MRCQTLSTLSLFSLCSLLCCCSAVVTPGGASRIALGTDTGMVMLKSNTAQGGEMVYVAVDENQSRTVNAAMSALKTKMLTDLGKKLVEVGVDALDNADARDASNEALDIQNSAETEQLQISSDAALQEAALTVE